MHLVCKSFRIAIVALIAKPMLYRHLSIRLLASELEILELYWKKSKRTKASVIRQFIRSKELTEEKALVEHSSTNDNSSKGLSRNNFDIY